MIRVSKKNKLRAHQLFCFANHDITFDVHRMRAQSFASSTNTTILYCAAKDILVLMLFVLVLIFQLKIWSGLIDTIVRVETFTECYLS